MCDPARAVTNEEITAYRNRYTSPGPIGAPGPIGEEGAYVTHEQYLDIVESVVPAQNPTFAQQHYRAIYWSSLVGRMVGYVALAILGGYWCLAIGTLLAFASFYEGITHKERAKAEIDARGAKRT